MKCPVCGKDYVTYNGKCPYCASKGKREFPEGSFSKSPLSENIRPPIPSDTRHQTGRINTQVPIRNRKSSNSILKYALTGGIVLLVVLSVAAIAQSFIGGSPLSASTPEVVVTPTSTNVPVPSLAPITSTTQPKITYSGSKAGTLSPYSGDTGQVASKPQATDFVAPGSRHTFAILSTTRSTSNSGSAVVYATPNPTTNPTALNTIIINPTTTTPTFTTITTTPTTITYTPTPVPKPPVILSVSPEQETVNAGETVNFNVIVESEIPPYEANWKTSTPLGPGFDHKETQPILLENGQWKIVVSQATKEYWPSGVVELEGVMVLFSTTNRGIIDATWSGSIVVRVNSDVTPPELKPVIVSIIPERTEIFAGRDAVFTVSVRSKLGAGHFGLPYYTYTLPNGKGWRVTGGLDYTTIEDDLCQAEIRIQTSGYWPTGDVAITEMVVTNAIEQPSDTWTTPVKVHVIGSPDTRTNGT